MHALIAHQPGCEVRDIRHVVAGAGFDCPSSDCVVWDELAVRLAQHDADVVLLLNNDGGAVDWELVKQARDLTTAPLLLVGSPPNGSSQGATRFGVTDHVRAEDLRDVLDQLVNRLTSSSQSDRQRGTIISVLAPTPGSGGTTVAANLAGSLAIDYPREVALVELTRHINDLALFLNATPQFTVAEVCQRWQTLDTRSLKNCFVEHASGLCLLSGTDDETAEGQLHCDAIRRIAMLSRTLFRMTLLALDSHLGSEEIEALKLSDIVLLVVRPDVPAVRRARRAIELAVQEGLPRERIRLVINRWGPSGQLPQGLIETQLGFDASHLIPDDPASVNHAVNEGLLLREIGRAKITRRFDELAASLNGSSQTSKTQAR